MKRFLAAAALAAAIALPTWAQAADPSVLRICTGSETGNYHWAASQIVSRIGTDVFQKIVPVLTSGSLMNLRKLASNECDMGFSQTDVIGQYIIENPASHDTLNVFKVVYEEYVHILCPVASGWTSLSDLANAKGQRRLILGEEGSGTAETWRIMRSVNDAKYGAIERNNQPVDITSASTVMDSKDTCMLWVSGLNSSDMIAANELSVRTSNGKPALQLITIDDDAMTKIKGPDGSPLYKERTISPQPAENGRPALYDHLINNGSWLSSASIEVLAIPAVLMIRTDYRDAIGRQKTGRIVRAIVDAQPTIWNRVNPAAD
jgi:TRAP-type uncharacterized transport system substrate-binding protein